MRSTRHPGTTVTTTDAGKHEEALRRLLGGDYSAPARSTRVQIEGSDFYTRVDRKTDTSTRMPATQQLSEVPEALSRGRGGADPAAKTGGDLRDHSWLYPTEKTSPRIDVGLQATPYRSPYRRETGASAVAPATPATSQTASASASRSRLRLSLVSDCGAKTDSGAPSWQPRAPAAAVASDLLEPSAPLKSMSPLEQLRRESAATKRPGADAIDSGARGPSAMSPNTQYRSDRFADTRTRRVSEGIPPSEPAHRVNSLRESRDVTLPRQALGLTIDGRLSSSFHRHTLISAMAGDTGVDTDVDMPDGQPAVRTGSGATSRLDSCLPTEMFLRNF